MGWFGYGPLDGDPGMDAHDELFGFIGVKYDEAYNILNSNEEIKQLLVSKQNEIYDHFDKYMYPQFFYHVIGYVYHKYNVPLNLRGLRLVLMNIKNDNWAKKDPDRATAMRKLYNDVVNDTFSLYGETHPELFV